MNTHAIWAAGLPHPPEHHLPGRNSQRSILPTRCWLPTCAGRLPHQSVIPRCCHGVTKGRLVKQFHSLKSEVAQQYPDRTIQPTCLFQLFDPIFPVCGGIYGNLVGEWLEWKRAWAIPARQTTAVVADILGKNTPFIHSLQGLVLQICSDKTDEASSVCLAALAKAMWAALRAFRPASAAMSTSTKCLRATSTIKSSWTTRGPMFCQQNWFPWVVPHCACALLMCRNTPLWLWPRPAKSEQRKPAKVFVQHMFSCKFQNRRHGNSTKERPAVKQGRKH